MYLFVEQTVLGATMRRQFREKENKNKTHKRAAKLFGGPDDLNDKMQDPGQGRSAL